MIDRSGHMHINSRIGIKEHETLNDRLFESRMDELEVTPKKTCLMCLAAEGEERKNNCLKFFGVFI